MDGNKKSRFLRYSLGAFQLFIGITAIAGGLGLVLDPSGTKSNVPLEWLNGSPFANYFIPGLVLLIGIGVGNTLAGATTFLRRRHAGYIAVGLSAFLVLYMVIEVALVGLRNLQQPLYFVLGTVVMILGLKLTKSVKAGHHILPKTTLEPIPGQ